jgi:hypothetical protein
MVAHLSKAVYVQGKTPSHAWEGNTEIAGTISTRTKCSSMAAGEQPISGFIDTRATPFLPWGSFSARDAFIFSLVSSAG